MLIKIWRSTHMVLAIFSTAFILAAAVSGVILSVEPIHRELQAPHRSGMSGILLADLLERLSQEYESVFELEVSEEGAIRVSTFDSDPEKNGDFIIDPLTGKKWGELPPPNPFFQGVTSFHRSLFLKSTGRIIVGIFSFLFLLILITGLLLLIKRDGGIRTLISRTRPTNRSQFLHVSISKLTWLPLMILAVTGVYLSLFRFGIIPEKHLFPVESPRAISDIPLERISDFPALGGIRLGQVRKIEFPFSEDEADSYRILLRDRELLVHQYTGEALAQSRVPILNRISAWNRFLHTGAGSVPWAIVLGLSTLGSLFLLYYGLVITFQRTRNALPTGVPPTEAEIVLLYGSENGATKQKAIALFRGLTAAGQRVFLGDLNSFQSFPSLQTLVLLTSTYGEGEAPANAGQFLEKMKKNLPEKPFDYLVLGFGSLAYPEYCRFAKDLDAALGQQSPAHRKIPLQLIHNQSTDEFLAWTRTLGDSLGLEIRLSQYLKVKPPRGIKWKILDRSVVPFEGQVTYLIRLKPLVRAKYQAGDLLNFYPDADPVKRSYSIGKDRAGNVLLAIKQHPKGVVSNFLLEAPVGSVVRAVVERNVHFHFPQQVPRVIFIGNGTGIGPFLGMLEENDTTPVELYWGGKSRNAYTLFQPSVEAALAKNKLKTVRLAFSREKGGARYVQDLLRQQRDHLPRTLLYGGVIMICGSLAMQKGVMQELDHLTQKYLGKPLAEFVDHGQILSDCY